MLQALQAYMKKPATIVGIVTAMMFQSIFSLIWMTGYQGVTENTGNLRIAVVNEDRGAGQKLAEKLGGTLPFRIETVDTVEEARQKLNERKVQMVLHLPADFSKQLQSAGQKAQINYVINESNPALIKSMMQSVASGITASAGKEASLSGAQAVLLQADMPQQQAQGMAQGTAQGLVDKVAANIEYMNPVHGMNNQMVPMMMLLASFVGAMIMGMNMQQATAMIGPGVSKWSKFGARVAINVVSAFVIALIGSSLVVALGGQTAGGFIALWLFQSLFLMTLMFFSQMFLILFGMAGMLFNIAMLSVQLVSSGAMVPRELLGSFYYRLSAYFPATYAVEGGMNLLFGGPSAAPDIAALIVILVICAAVGLLVTALRKDASPVRSDAPSAAPAPSGA